MLLASDTTRIGGQTLLQAGAREQAGGLGAVGPISFSEPMQNDHTCFYSEIILNLEL